MYVTYKNFIQNTVTELFAFVQFLVREFNAWLTRISPVIRGLTCCIYSAENLTRHSQAAFQSKGSAYCIRVEFVFESIVGNRGKRSLLR